MNRNSGLQALVKAFFCILDITAALRAGDAHFFGRFVALCQRSSIKGKCRLGAEKSRGGKMQFHELADSSVLIPVSPRLKHGRNMVFLLNHASSTFTVL